MTGLEALLEAGAVRTVGWTLGHSVWQGALVALAVGLLLRLVPRRLPELRYGIAAAGLAALALGVAATGTRLAADWREHAGCWERIEGLAPGPQRVAAVGRAAAGAGAAAAGAGPAVAAPLTPAEARACASHGVFRKEEGARRSAGRGRETGITPASLVVAATPAAGWAALLWALGLLVCGARLGRDLLVARRLADGARALTGGAAAEALARAAGRLDVRRPVRLCVSDEVDSPCVLGWARPVVLVPEEAARAVDPRTLEAVLGHELAHVRRRDYAANLAQRGLEAAFFFNPFARWISARIREEREACCDRRAAGGSRDALGRYMAAVCAFERVRRGRGSVASGVGLHRGEGLLPRMRRLVESSRPTARIPRRRLALRLAAAAAVVGLGAHALTSTTDFWAHMSSFGVMAHDNAHREKVSRPPVLAADRGARPASSTRPAPVHDR